jgi:hypothetical protein
MPTGIYKRTNLICGVGINDAACATSSVINGKRVICPFYKTWTSMLSRCYSETHHKIWPTYIGCTVASEWFSFRKFSSWMDKQDWHGKSLDKDILIQYNKVYSPLTCIFVNADINSFLNNCTSVRGKFPRGVCFNKKREKYRADCMAYGKKKTIGCYDTPEEAHEAYKKFKYKYIAEIANQQSEPLRTALLNYKIEG